MPHLTSDPPPGADPVLWRMAYASLALAHPSRLALLESIVEVDAACLEALSSATGLAHPTVRQHLRLLGRAGLVRPGPSLSARGPCGRPRKTYGVEPEGLGQYERDLAAFLDRVGDPAT